MEKDKPIQFRVDDRLEAQITARAAEHGGPNYAARVGLERYYYLLGQELVTLREAFTLGELGLMADVTNGWFVENHSIPWLYMEVEDSALEGHDKKWKVSAKTLSVKLQKLSYAQSAALVDALKRWWNLPGPIATKEGFGQVGLIAKGSAK